MKESRISGSLIIWERPFMGAYYLCANPGSNEFIMSGLSGGGLKKPEVLHGTTGVLDALLFLLADPGLNKRRPADLNIPQTTGKWAGQRCFFVSDNPPFEYTAPWKWQIPEDEMYDEMISNGKNLSSKCFKKIQQCHGLIIGVEKYTIRMLDGKTTKDTFKVPFLLKMAEGNISVVNPEHNSFSEAYENAVVNAKKIKPKDYLIDAYDGTRRLIANLDRKEYIDPRHMAEIPTLAGMMRAQSAQYNLDLPNTDHSSPTSISLLGHLLFPKDTCESAIDGMWYGDRVILTAETSKHDVNTHSIETDPSWLDITPKLISHQPDVDWKIYYENVNTQRFGEICRD